MVPEDQLQEIKSYVLPLQENILKIMLEQYKVILGDCISIADRRWRQHTFFLSISAAMLTVSGVFWEKSKIIVLILYVFGIVLSFLWFRLHKSLLQKTCYYFDHLKQIEFFLPIQVYSHESVNQKPTSHRETFFIYTIGGFFILLAGITLLTFLFQ